MSQFVDEVTIYARGGAGGNGCVSFRREAHVPKGGPDGGNGGNGGSVYLRADRNVSSLVALRDHPHCRAASGTHGKGKKLDGATGDDLYVPVPLGTVAYSENDEVLGDLVHDGDALLIAQGGQGGRGNARFLSNRRRAPGFAELGEKGEETTVALELKLLADVALVGMPNAGKSTLISALSAAKPKIADYPFTTLEPHLGVVRSQGYDFIIADIPGLIEGAAQGKGLGHEFLRHIERARVVVLLLDLSAGMSPQRQEELLLRELQNHKAELLDRPRLVVGNKIDVATAAFNGLCISGVTRAGLDRFVQEVGALVTDARNEEPHTAPIVVIRPAAEGVTVARDDDGAWRVVGRAAERAVAVSNASDPEAAAYIHSRLNKLGVERELVSAGVSDGDTVRIGETEFTYGEDLQ